MLHWRIIFILLWSLRDTRLRRHDDVERVVNWNLFQVRSRQGPSKPQSVDYQVMP
jgi:hypothetical protein